MDHVSPNRFRISSNFFITILALGIAILSFAMILIKDIANNRLDYFTLIGFGFTVLTCALILYYLKRIKRIDYDDIKHIIYIVDERNQTEVEVPVERIDKIQYSSIGVSSDSSFVIFYRDIHGRQQKFRLFPILFDNSIKTIIIDTKIKNPEVVVREWSFFW